MQVWVWLIPLLGLAWLIFLLVAVRFKLEERGLYVGLFWAMFKTQKFNSMLRVMARPKRFWRRLGNVSVVAGFIAMFLGFVGLVYNLLLIIGNQDEAVGLIPVVPGVTISFGTFLWLIVPIGVTMVLHEMSHGILAWAEGVPVKSSGLLVFAILFGAFVEPEEEAMEKASRNSKLRILAAGAFSNIVLAVVSLLILLALPTLASPLYNQESGAMVGEVVDDSPAEAAGIERGDIIIAIGLMNQTSGEFGDKNITSVDDFYDSLRPLVAGQLVRLQTEQRIIELSAMPYSDNATKGLVGIVPTTAYNPKLSWLPRMGPYVVKAEIQWLLVLNVGVAVFNLLPLWVTDGDKMIQELVRDKDGKMKQYGLLRLRIMRLVALTLLGSAVILGTLRGN